MANGDSGFFGVLYSGIGMVLLATPSARMCARDLGLNKKRRRKNIERGKVERKGRSTRITSIVRVKGVTVLYVDFVARS